ncbi:MAG: hypothetical protein BIFFINMI_03918 [Phycisphaerae bacterium]|nr:hypothetical protein [Phycisphaerae bacterium]
MRTNERSRRVRVLVGATLLAAIVAGGVWGCSGPRPLGVAIRPADKEAWSAAVAANPSRTPRDIFLAQRARETGQSVEQATAADAALSHTRNPFDANKDPEAVSRGAVLYENYCSRCHGPDADGRGPDMPRVVESMNWHAFGTRFAVTIHRGAPRSWFSKIHDGHDGGAKAADGRALVMPAFKDELAVEQIWLLITYMQSLDAYAPSVR